MLALLFSEKHGGHKQNSYETVIGHQNVRFTFASDSQDAIKQYFTTYPDAYTQALLFQSSTRDLKITSDYYSKTQPALTPA